MAIEPSVCMAKSQKRSWKLYCVTVIDDRIWRHFITPRYLGTSSRNSSMLKIAKGIVQIAMIMHYFLQQSVRYRDA